MPKITIHPTGPFLYVDFIPRQGKLVVLPDGQRDPDGDVICLSVGPDVPENQGIKVGSKLLLRGDAKIFAAPNADGTFEQDKGPACIDYRSVMGVIEESTGDCEEELTDEQIEAIRLG